jgi:hypothetical protein
MQYLINVWRTSTAWRRERVGRTSTVVDKEKERPHGMDPVAIGEAVGEVGAWIRRWWRRHGVEVDALEEWACGMDPAVIGEALV